MCKRKVVSAQRGHTTQAYCRVLAEKVVESGSILTETLGMVSMKQKEGNCIWTRGDTFSRASVDANRWAASRVSACQRCVLTLHTWQAWPLWRIMCSDWLSWLSCLQSVFLLIFKIITNKGLEYLTLHVMSLNNNVLV